ncbi:unnamed protein product [Brassica oleracea var. botrytis]
MVLTPPTEVFAELRFFVYNKKENKYFTIQGKLPLMLSLYIYTYSHIKKLYIFSDVEVKRFNALKTRWGMQQVLPCDTFNNPDNGYIFEGGQCEFGVDVIVAPPLTNWEVLSFTEKYSDPKFSWTIKKISELKEDTCAFVCLRMLTSSSYLMLCRVLKLYPKGDPTADGKWLSVFLYLADCDKPKADEKIFVQANMRVLGPLGSNHFKLQMETWYTEQTPAWGWSRFLSLAELGKVHLDKEDMLKVEIEFKVVSATKYSPII